ncbi:hypothetical protein B0H14DRAFT_3497927 [Mycena olivaceomarginata]|nr:hypothetical protein B0H14DRAFT_3497927 [Mycena olivaceomarginata]
MALRLGSGPPIRRANRGRRPTPATHLPATSPGLRLLHPSSSFLSFTPSLFFTRSLLPPVPFLPCSRFERTHIDDDHARTSPSALAHLIPSPASSASPALHVRLLFWRAPLCGSTSCSFLPALPPSLLHLYTVTQ